MYIHIM